MKKRLILFLCLTLFASATLGAVEPIGSIGEGVLRQAHFLPDGTVLRVMVDRIEIVNPDTDEVIDKFAEGLNWAAVTLSPNGVWLAIPTYVDGTKDSLIEIWEIATRRLIQKLELKSGAGLVVFSNAAPLLAISDRDQIHLWNWKNNEYLGEMIGERQKAKNCYSRTSSQTCLSPPGTHTLVFSPDDRFLVVGSARPDAEIWEVSTRKLVGHLEGHADWVTHASYSFDGRYIATAEPDSTRVYLWDAQTRELMATVRSGGEGEIRKLLFSSDSQRLYVAAQTGNWAAAPNKRNDQVRIFDVHTGAQLNEFGAEHFILVDFSLSPDEKTALFQHHISAVVLWDIEHNHRVALWADYSSGHDWKLSPDGRSLVTVNGAMMKIWDVPSRSLRKVIVPQNRWFREFDISPDSQTIAIGQDPWIELRDIYTGEVTTQFDYYYGHSTVVFSQTGNRIATERLIFDVNNPNNQQLLERRGDSYYASIAFSAEDSYLAARNSKDNLIHLWEQQEGKYVYRYVLPSPVKGSLTFIPSSDGVPILASFSSERMAVWELREQPQRLLILELDTNSIWNSAFSSDGRYLFFNSYEGLQIWDWRAQKRIQHPPFPDYLAVSRDRSVLLTWEEETQKILIWDGRTLFPPEPTASYDINRDGTVNILDLVQAASQFGQSGDHLAGDVTGDGKVDVSDLGHIGSQLGENAAAPSVHLSRLDLAASYSPSHINRQFQALTVLKSLENPSHGAHIAREMLKTWLARIKPSVRETKLLPNYPNPFNPETWIPYQLSESAHVQIRIYDVTGHLVRQLYLGTKLAGSHLSREDAAYWDGRNDIGEEVSSGIYFYTLEAGDYRRTRQMTVVR